MLQETNIVVHEVETRSPSQSVFLVPFFNTFFYLALVPFRIQLDEIKNCYFLQTFKLQQVVCAISQVAAVFFTSFTAYQSITHVQNNIIYLFEVVTNVSSIWIFLILIQILWTHDKTHLLNFIEATRPQHVNHPKLNQLLITCATLLVTLTINILSFRLISNGDHYISVSFLSNVNSEFSESENLNFNGTGDNIFTAVLRLVKLGWVLVAFQSTNYYVFSEELLFIIALTIVTTGKEFVKLTSATSTPTCFLLLYRKMRKLTADFRQAFGNYLLLYYLSSLPYFAEAPYIVSGKRETLEVVMLSWGIVNSSVLWMMAAEFHYTVKNSVFKWITENSEEMERQNGFQLLSVFNEMSSIPVAISCKCFAVTYAHVGKMLGCIFTYGIIVLQVFDK